MSAADHLSWGQAKKNLTPEDFEFLASVSDVGFSVRAFPPDVGSKARDAYIVGHAEHNAPVMPHASVTGKTIEDFVNQRKAALSKPDMYAGAWTERDENEVPTDTYLDVSEALPRTHEGRAAAVKRGLATGEKALGVVNEHGDYVGQIDLENRDPLAEWASTFMEFPDAALHHEREVRSGNRPW